MTFSFLSSLSTCRPVLASLLLAAGLVVAGCKKDDNGPKRIITNPPPPASSATVAPGDAVVYEAYARDFTPGTFAGVQARLDSIKALGCNVLWLMPIHPIGQARRVGSLGSPYSVRDYQSVNPEYGNLTDFDNLVAAAHAKNIVVILDWVANHTAWDHAWIGQHPDWYTKDASGNIIAPAGTGWADVADLNFTSQPMRQEMIKAMKFWVKDHSVDGFRCDAADMVPTDFWQQAIDSVNRVRSGLFWLAEGGTSPAQYTAGFQLLYGWNFYDGLKQVFRESGAVTKLTTAHTAELAGAPVGKYRLRFTTNHDFTVSDGTPPQWYGSADAAKAAYVATLAYGTAPLIYNGQEAGDTRQLNLFERQPINFSASAATTTFYRGVLKLYNAHPALRTGTVSPAADGNPDVVRVLRTLGADRALVLVNVRNHASTATIPSAWATTAWTDALTGQPIGPTPTELTLPPYGYAIWRGN